MLGLDSQLAATWRYSTQVPTLPSRQQVDNPLTAKKVMASIRNDIEWSLHGLKRTRSTLQANLKLLGFTRRCQGSHGAIGGLNLVCEVYHRQLNADIMVFPG